MSVELVVAVFAGILWLGLIVAVVGFISFRLRKRALRRGTWPLRIIPWYLGGTPDMPLDTPSESLRGRRGSGR
jgi:hypothetical protein